MFIKESFVHTIPFTDGNHRWVTCSQDECGYERTKDDHSNGPNPFLRMFKVNGMQVCEGCLNDWIEEIHKALIE